MGEQTSEIQSDDFQSTQLYVNKSQELPGANLTSRDTTVPRRLEWIAIILFVVNFFMMFYLFAFFMNEEAWGLFAVTVCTVTSVILLLSVIFSIFGQTELSKIAVGSGIVGLMITTVSLGVRLLQQISEWGDRFNF